MNLPKYTKADMKRSIERGEMPTISDNAAALLMQHVELAHARLPEFDKWMGGFVRVVIWENESWPYSEQIENHLKDFLLAIRSGRVTIKSNTVLAYADAHRDFIYAKSQSNFKQAASESDFQYNPQGIQFTGLNSDLKKVSAWALTEHECFTSNYEVRIKRNIIDMLEGIERFGNIKKSDEYRREYEQAKRVYKAMTDIDWTPFEWESRNDKGYLNL